MYHKGVVIINDVPTVVETWGRWIEESPSQQNEDIILCIPGNPGVTGYYKNFLQTIYDKLQCTIWVLGHAGHQRIRNNNIKVPKLEGNEKLYSVQGQIDHKVSIWKKNQNDVQLIVILYYRRLLLINTFQQTLDCS